MNTAGKPPSPRLFGERPRSELVPGKAPPSTVRGRSVRLSAGPGHPRRSPVLSRRAPLDRRDRWNAVIDE